MSNKYEPLAEELISKIVSGKYKPGQKIVSENSLAQKYNMSRETVRLALNIVEQEGYIERRKGSGTFVRQFLPRESKRIAVVTTYLDSYIFPKIIQGIGNTLSKNGYSMELYFTNNQSSREREVLSSLIQKDDIAGIIMEPVKSAYTCQNIDCYEKIMEQGVRLLFINTYYRELNVPHVSINDEETAKKATQYLIDKGHTKIGALLKVDDGQGQLRHEGFRNALLENHLEIPEEKVIWYDAKDLEAFDKQYGRIISRFEDCTAVFCYNDEVATALILAAKENKMSIPDRLSVISIDDSPLASMSEVKLTSFSHPSYELGKTAAETIILMLKDRKYNASQEFSTKIAERESVRDISKKKEGEVL